MVKDYYVDWETFTQQVIDHEDRLVASLASLLLDQSSQTVNSHGRQMSELFYTPYDYSFPYLSELALARYMEDEELRDGLEDCLGLSGIEDGQTPNMIPIGDIEATIGINFRMEDYIKERLEPHFQTVLNADEIDEYATCAIITNQGRNQMAIIDNCDASKLIIRAIPLTYIQRVDGDMSKVNPEEYAIVIFVPSRHVKTSNLPSPAILPEAAEKLNVQKDLLDNEWYTPFVIVFGSDPNLASPIHEEVLQTLSSLETTIRKFYKVCEAMNEPCFFPGPSIN